MKRSILSLVLFLAPLADTASPAPAVPAWQFNLKAESSGVVALESMVVSPNLAIFFNRASNDPLQINGHSAWGALFNLQTGEVRALSVLTNSFCGGGAFLSNGTMASIGGDELGFPGNPAIKPGNQAIRLFAPCASPAGDGCALYEDPNLLLLQKRWYPSAARIFDGSLIIVGGMHVEAIFYNTDPENSIEFFPRKEETVRPSPFLERSLPANMFPRIFALPDGKVFMIANNRSVIYDVETDTETPLPDIPNGVRITNPIDGSAILLPLSPPDFTPQVLVCGGSNADDRTPVEDLSSQTPASSQCSRITLTPEGIAAGWEIDNMLSNRTMNELVHLPNGQILIANGAGSGFAGIKSVQQPIGNSNADHAVLVPELYTPSAALGQRFSNAGMPSSGIARVYHSTITLTPQGNFLIAGSNPNRESNITGPGVEFPSEFRVQTLDPPYMFVERPKILSIPDKLGFDSEVTVPISLPESLSHDNGKVQVSLMDLGFSTHGFHVGARLVFMDATISKDKKSLTFVTPPNGRVYPPGPATVFLTIDDVSSEGAWVMMGSGRAPPTLE